MASTTYTPSLSAYAQTHTSGGYTAASKAAAAPATGPATRHAASATSHTDTAPSSACTIFKRAGTSVGSVPDRRRASPARATATNAG